MLEKKIFLYFIILDGRIITRIIIKRFYFSKFCFDLKFIIFVEK